VPEQYLTSGLALDETDLKRATVDRHGPAHDVTSHRKNLEKERQRARAYQALLLLSIGVRRSAAGKALLREWAETADPDLATAAWAALAMYGDPVAARALQERAVEKGALPVVEQLLAEVTPPGGPGSPRKVEGATTLRCTTCGRGHDEVTHMIAGGNSVICDRCVVHVTQNRATLGAPDDATCALCGRSHFESAGLYRYNKVDICNHCVQLSLGLKEREEVDSFLAAWVGGPLGRRLTASWRPERAWPRRAVASIRGVAPPPLAPPRAAGGDPDDRPRRRSGFAKSIERVYVDGVR
jgi:ATP-dependent protease Clp, ATPase subunit